MNSSRPDDKESESSILKKIKSNYEEGEFYFEVTEDVIVCFNPAKSVGNEASLSELFVNTYGRHGFVSPDKKLPPHIHGVAMNIYNRLKWLSEDQALVLLGNTNSGKTTQLKMLLKTLVTLSKQNHQEKKVHRQIEATHIVLDAFGNCMTAHNNHSSKFALIHQLLFKKGGKLTGAHTMDLLLDTTRVTDIPEGERGFHIFYYFLSGAPSSMKTMFGLQEGASNYHYLAESKHFKIPNVNDSEQFSVLLDSFKSLGINTKMSQDIFSVLAAILHLGNLTFSVSGSKIQEACKVVNEELLERIASLLGLTAKNLETTLVYTTKTVNKDHFTAFLTLDEVYNQRDALARILYQMLFRAIVEFMNHRYYKDSAESVLTTMDIPGQNNDSVNSFFQFLWNFASEKMWDTFFNRIRDNENVMGLQQIPVGDTKPLASNSNIMTLYTRPTIGMLPTLQDLYLNRLQGNSSDDTMIVSFNKSLGTTGSYIVTKNPNSLFGINHTGGTVVYSKQDFISNNEYKICPDFVMLFRGGPEVPASTKGFLCGLFTSANVRYEFHQDSPSLVTTAHYSMRPLRTLVTGRNSEAQYFNEKASTDMSLSSQFEETMNDIVKVFQQSHQYTAICIHPLKSNTESKWDSKKVKQIFTSYSVVPILKKSRDLYSCALPGEVFTRRYRRVLQSSNINMTTKDIDNARALALKLEWSPHYYTVGKDTLFIRQPVLQQLEEMLATEKKKERKSKTAAGEKVPESVVDDDASSIAPSEVTDQTFNEEESFHNFNPTMGLPTEVNEKILLENNLLKKKEEVEIVQMTRTRRNWLLYVKLNTWWIPERCLKWRMDRPDVRLAWREKVALFISVFFLSAIMIFLIIGLGKILCPSDNVFSIFEISYRNTLDEKPVTALYGHILDIKDFSTYHQPESNLDQAQFFQFFGGKDVKSLFLIPRSVCGVTSDEKKALGLAPFKIVNQTDLYILEDVYTHQNPQGDLQQMIQQYNAGTLVWSTSYLEAMVNQQESNFVIYKQEVFDISDYIADKTVTEAISNIMFPGTLGVQFKKQLSQVDWTNFMNAMAPSDLQRSLKCLRTLFAVGMIDERQGAKCLFSEYMLLAASILMSSVIVIKFLAALQLGSRRRPERYDKFTIIQIPCYTEGEESIRRTVETCATMDYDDQRKLLFVIADGMIIGGGNDRPTPRIVLDVLGVDPHHDPEPLCYHALGEGGKQFNLAKVYSGLYEVEGHVVPYLVVVKCGKASERARPGNRGKRDSQLILMKFLSRVHYDEPMSPMELEIYHQMKNVIGVDPSFYDYLLMIDSDTEVFEDSLTRLVASCQHDTKIMGICGETVITNDRQSWVTMIQVYEYYISHHLSKAFESLFGTVTCLPGCFCMYRIKTAQRNVPLIISRGVIKDYTENNVDTLHKKNLLHLGEDRYLTTLMLKHFPHMKLVFTADAKCKTVVPDRWPVLLSQRRRWINSTVHNLFELLTLNELCGFCFFSMRFVVFVDLFATLTGPATVCYLIYLIVLLSTESATTQSTPYISLIMFAAVYGLQAIIFILHRRWENIGWMIIYILAIPVFSFYIPLYSFWHFDDFSWGNTRVVVGDGGKQQVIHGEGDVFDPKDITWAKWSDFNHSNYHDIHAPPYSDSASMVSGIQQQQEKYRMSMASTLSNPYGAPAVGIGMNESVNTSGEVYENHDTLPSDGSPTDDELVQEITHILAVSDLSSITKKSVREQLNFHFAMNLDHRRDFINNCIDKILHNMQE